MPRKMTTRQARDMAAMRKAHSGGPGGAGRPRTGGPRCNCGAMTEKRAKARAHKC